MSGTVDNSSTVLSNYVRNSGQFLHSTLQLFQKLWQIPPYYSPIMSGTVENSSILLSNYVRNCGQFLHFTVQSCRAGNSLIRSSLICSFRSNQLSSWANHSGRSEEMSESERIAQVAQDKWATVSNLLRSLRGNERMSASQKNFFWLKSCFLVCSNFLLKISESLNSSF